jgi:hypothetical protein
LVVTKLQPTGDFSVTGSNASFNPTGAAAIEVDDGFEYDPSYAYDAAKDEPKAEDPYGYGGAYGQGDEEEDLLKQEDYWTIITTFFEEKGLVRQQLESFNEFVENTMQEIVDENSRLMLDQHQQYTGESTDTESVSDSSQGDQGDALGRGWILGRDPIPGTGYRADW